ncbi:hypothetical protein ACKA04_04460 [Helcococcus kunzii]|uniref:hypothetical protein n=1 Tax=Helcococcus kunzii TaxID=40091 RepID=UPI0038A72C06
MKGTLQNGFEFEIDEKELDDYELMELFAEADENPLASPKIITKILGKEQKDELKEHIRDKKTGKVSIEEMTNSFIEILQFNQKIKN